jgi:hypothetical protein
LEADLLSWLDLASGHPRIQGGSGLVAAFTRFDEDVLRCSMA